MSFDWESLVRTVAPTLGLALGGPLGGIAAKTISEAVLGKPDGSQDEIGTALASASNPDLLLKLKQADQQFQHDMEALDVDLERIHQADRDSARKREVDAHDSWTPRLLAAVITLGFFGVLGDVLAVGLPENGGEAALILLGSLGTAWTGIVAYYFGSSAGSKAKTELMAKVKQT